MKLLAPEIAQIHLKPGELVVCREPRIVITVLGSCVAVTMFHARLRLAAICHAMLPEQRSDDTAVIELGRFRYVNQVVPIMCGYYQDVGAKPGEVEVKLFGGGNVINIAAEPSSDRWIGSANVRMARELLRRNGFTIHASNVDGSHGRKILFNTGTGEVLHKHLDRRLPQRLP